MASAPNSTIDKIEAVVNTKVEKFLRVHYQQRGYSFREISEILRDDFDLTVSQHTLRKIYLDRVGLTRSRSEALTAYYGSI